MADWGNTRKDQNQKLRQAYLMSNTAGFPGGSAYAQIDDDFEYGGFAGIVHFRCRAMHVLGVRCDTAGMLVLLAQ